MNVFQERYRELGVTTHPVKLLPSLRVNTLKTSEKKIIEILEGRGFELKKIPFAKYGYWIEKAPFSIGASLEYLEGKITPQEAASQLPVQVLEPQPGELVLDMAAAPGGKTSQIAQLMNNEGQLIAVEKNNRRIVGLKSNVERLGVENCLIYNTDAVKIAESSLKFDKILLDAPCMSNYAKEKDWAGKHDLDELKRNTSTQKALIASAITMLKKGGALVYSTCSLEPEENELLIDWALRNHPVRCISTKLDVGDEGYTKVFGKPLTKEVGHTRRFWPHKTNTQGFFIAKLVRK
jgi:NOL1/NOP2/sun family putative RNA methylase